MTDGPRVHARRRIDPLRATALVLLLAVGGFIVVVTLDEGPAGGPPAVKAPAAADVARAEPVDPAPGGEAGLDQLAEQLAEKPVKTKKGKLLKSELEKRAGNKRLASARVDVVLSGDAALKRAVGKRLKGVRIVDSGERGLFVILKNEVGISSDGVFSKCSATVSELPNKKLLGALSSRSDVGGEGVSDRELKDDATAACAQALAEDVGAFVRKRR